MSTQEGSSKGYEEYFTDFEGRFKARLSRVIPSRAPQLQGEGRFSGISARYDCRIKVEYHSEIMKLLEEGMLLAVRNFRSAEESERFTLLEISKILPEHFGLRGLSDHSYYPMQFEIIEQAVPDWSTDDRSTMMVHASAIPINYDLVLGPKGPEFLKGFSFPKLGEEALLLNSRMINRMYNESVLERLQWKGEAADVWDDPRVGTIRMFLSHGRDLIPMYLDFESLLRYHFGIFSFTGGGKSNLMANILRRMLFHLPDCKVVIFDVSCEYPFLLADIFSNDRIPSLLVLDGETSSAAELANSIVKPKQFEDEERANPLFQRMLDLGRVEDVALRANPRRLAREAGAARDRGRRRARRPREAASAGGRAPRQRRAQQQRLHQRLQPVRACLRVGQRGRADAIRRSAGTGAYRAARRRPVCGVVVPRRQHPG